MKFNKALYILGFSFLSGASFWSCQPEQQKQTEEKPQIIQEKSAIGNEENPQARKAYEMAMLVDPATGMLPKDIRRQELRFSRRILSREQFNRQRRSADNLKFNGGEWQAEGPSNIGGRTRALAIDVNDESRLLAGAASGGMWLSENGGTDWQKVTDAASLHSVTCLTQDSRSGKTDTWYYGTGEMVGNTAEGGAIGSQLRGDGVFKSTDGGKSWQLLTSTSSQEPQSFNSHFNYIWNITTNPFNESEDEVLVAAFGGILRSTDGGSSWDLVLGDGLQNASSFFSDILITNDGTYYASLSQLGLGGNRAETHGIFRSTNGVDWEKLNPSAPTPTGVSRRTVMAAAPSDPNILYFFIDGDKNSFLRYDASKEEWLALHQNIPAFGGEAGDYDSQSSYNMLLKVHPQNPDWVFLGGTNLYRSRDGFRSRNNTDWIGGYHPNNDLTTYPGHHADQHALVFYPSDPSKVLSGHDGGVSVSTDISAGNVAWNSLNNGYVTAQFYTIAIDPQNPDGLMLGGMQDNGTYGVMSSQNTGPWKQILSGDGSYCAVAPNARFAYVSFQNSQIYRISLDTELEIDRFARIDPVGAGINLNQEYLFVNPFVLDPNNYNKMYLAGGDKVWINTNLSQVKTYNQEPTATNWHALTNTRVSNSVSDQVKHQVSALGVSTVPANVLYYGTTKGKLYKVPQATHTGAEVTDLTYNLQGATSCTKAGSTISCLQNAYISSIAVDPTDADKLLVVLSNYSVPSAFYSEDGGQTFTDVSANLEENPDGSGNGPSVRWASILPLKEGGSIYLLGTSTGLYSSDQLAGNSTYWAQEGRETIGNVVIPMMTYRPTDGKVLAASHGNGLYSRTFNGLLDKQPEPEVEDVLAMEAPFPNPFKERTSIDFNLPEDGLTTARIFDSQGKQIKTLLYSRLDAGLNQLSWDGTNTEGRPVSAGVYVVRIEFKGQQSTQKVVHVK